MPTKFLVFSVSYEPAHASYCLMMSGVCNCRMSSLKAHGSSDIRRVCYYLLSCVPKPVTLINDAMSGSVFRKKNRFFDLVQMQIIAESTHTGHSAQSTDLPI
jgi:hypothetical protein